MADLVPAAGNDDRGAPSKTAMLNGVFDPSSRSIRLTWARCTDNVGVDAYNVYRGGQKIATTGFIDYTDTIQGPVLDSYRYSIGAVDGAGNEAKSSEITVPAASPYGRLLRAVPENDQVALSLGKPVSRIRAQVMLIGSALAAVSGVLFALNVGFVSTNDYVVTLTLDVWVMCVVGGLAPTGALLLGAFVITVLDRVTAVLAIQLNMMGSEFELNYLRYILVGVILLLVLRYRPKGLLPEPQHTTDAHRLALSIEERKVTVD